MHIVDGGIAQSHILFRIDVNATLRATYTAAVYGVAADDGTVAPPTVVPPHPRPPVYAFGAHCDGELLARTARGSKRNRHPLGTRFTIRYDGPLKVTYVEIRLLTHLSAPQARTRVYIVAGCIYRTYITIRVDIQSMLNASYTALVFGVPVIIPPPTVPPPPPPVPPLYAFGQRRYGDLLDRSASGSKRYGHPTPTRFTINYDGPTTVTYVEIRVTTVNGRQ